jgi:ABC-type sugar transport system permease subunit
MKDSTCKKNTQFVLSFIILIFWFTILILYFSSYFYLNNYNLLNFGFDQKRNFIIKKNMNVIKKYRKNLLSIIIISLLYLILLIIVLFMIKIKNGLDNIITVYRRDFHLEIEGKN